MKKTIDQKIDELARITKGGFDELEGKMDKRFGEMDKRFDEVDKRFGEMDKRFDRLEYLVSGHDRRIEILEDRMRQVAVKVGLKFN